MIGARRVEGGFREEQKYHVLVAHGQGYTTLCNLGTSLKSPLYYCLLPLGLWKEISSSYYTVPVCPARL